MRAVESDRRMTENIFHRTAIWLPCT